MQVSVEAGEGLERRVTVQVPAETIELAVNNRLNSIKNTVKMDGFRQGKVPLKVVKQKYSASVLQEVAGEVMQSTFQQAMSQEKLTPAGMPNIEGAAPVLGQVMEYTAVFEVFPEVTLAPISDLTVEKTEANIEDSDVENMIETLRKQKLDWNEVERVSADGDRLSVDFVGSVDGEVFDGGTANDMPMVLGSGRMIPGFEEKLMGLKVSDETTFAVPFPDDYASKELAGKEAEFAVTVKKVEEPVMPEVDEEFAKQFGVESGDIGEFKAEIKGNMTRELNKRLKGIMKKSVMNGLLEANPIDVPTATVMQEAEALKKQNEEQMPNSVMTVDSYVDTAKSRVQLSMILSEVAKQSGINIDDDMVKSHVEYLSEDYDDPDEFVRYYMNSQELLSSVQTLVMENEVVDWVEKQVTVNTITSTFEAVMSAEETATVF